MKLIWTILAFMGILTNGYGGNMDVDKQKKTVKQLEGLLKYTKELDLPEYSCKKICIIIQMELDMEQRELFIALGKKSYNDELEFTRTK